MRSLFDVRTLFFALALTVFGGFAGAFAAPAATPIAPAAASVLLPADWQDPLALPRHLRNHCYTDSFSGRRYCSDHCGGEYQMFYCSPRSFGCCRAGFGYCDWNGVVRCHP